MNDRYNNNVKLSYEYIEKSIIEVQNISNNTNTKLGLLIGFNFTFIRFFINELPASKINDYLFCYSCLALQILSYLLAFTSIIFCFLRLYQSVKFEIITPQQLISAYDLEETEFRLAILDTWEDKLEKLIEINEQKKKFLNRSILFLVFSGLMVMFDRLIHTFFLS